jgi:putative transcriptional regulator
LHHSIAGKLLYRPTLLRGPELRFLRKHVGFKAVDLAKRLSVEPETVSRWESGAQAICDEAS